jgi:hypothetical protein
MALLAAGCSPSSPAQSESGVIFRYIQIGGGVIQLGHPLPSAVPTPAAGDTVVALPAQQIGGAEAIRVHLTPEGLVRGLWFEYAAGADYEAMTAEYTDMLGKPRLEAFGVGQRAIWEDAQTRFELTRDPERSASTVYSVLSDRTGE